jgi:hypothetical protein
VTDEGGVMRLILTGDAAGASVRATSAAEKLVAAVARLPVAVVLGLLRLGVGSRCLAVCLHQVRGNDDPPHPFGDGSSREADVDALVEGLASALPRPRQLCVTFDDGYLAAADFVRARAPRFPAVEWLFFVCPQKIERRDGFRWDARLERLREREGARPARGAAAAPPSNGDAPLSLEGLADHPSYRLASVEECRSLARLPNVALGNHSNAHAEWNETPLAQVREDVLGSFDDFERLFGACSEFAIPFGTPGRFFGDQHVELIRARSQATVWTTEGRPYRREDRRPSAVLPRFGVEGSWPARYTLALIAIRCLRNRGRRPSEAAAV